LGGPIPEKYTANIQAWMQENPDYAVNLWIDSAATPPRLVEEAMKRAKIAAVNVCDVNGNRKDLLEAATTSRFYQDEVTGLHANYGAGCDLLRLEILERHGGVYIDVDIRPTIGNPLGTIEVNESMGIKMLKGAPNDVLASVPHGQFIQTIRKRALKKYQAVYSSPDEEMAETMDLHRSKRPWKERFETTYAWTGPQCYQEAFNEAILTKSVDQQVYWLNEMMPASFGSKFQMASDQNWCDKGPKTLVEKNQYVKEELLFRLKHLCLRELNALICLVQPPSSNQRLVIALQTLRKQLQKSSELFPLYELINTWVKANPDVRIPLTINVLSELMQAITCHLDSCVLTESQLNQIQQQLFPGERYTVTDCGVFLNRSCKNISMQQAHEIFFSICPLQNPPRFNDPCPLEGEQLGESRNTIANAY